MATITLTVNGTAHTVTIDEGRVTLADVLRDQLNLTGTKIGCGVGKCGSCTVLLNGEPVTSCTTLAARADRGDVLTIEGLPSGSSLHPIQEAFIEAGAIQCGFCTPGFVLRTHALLRTNPDPDDEAIRQALKGNLCRCTGYEAIFEAVKLANKKLRTDVSS